MSGRSGAAPKGAAAISPGSAKHSSEDDQANLNAALARGDLNWTVIPQPLSGPLQLDWDIEGYPSVYIVDAEGILHPQLHMPYHGEGGYDTKEIDEKLDERPAAALYQEYEKGARRFRSI